MKRGKAHKDIMERKTFEQFLQDMHAKTYAGLDDDMQDNFETWIVNKDIEEICEYAELYGRKMYIEGKELIINSMGK